MVEQLPYVMKLLNNRIKMCRGCGSLISRKADRSIPDPPNDFVMAHEERRPFADANKVTRISRLQNHPNVACICRQHTSFMGPEIQVPAVIYRRSILKNILVGMKWWTLKYKQCNFLLI